MTIPAIRCYHTHWEFWFAHTFCSIKGVKTIKGYFLPVVLSVILVCSAPAFSETGKDTLVEAIDSYNFLDYTDAIAKTKRAVKILKNRGDLVSAYTYMGASYIAQNKVSKGIEAFTRMLQIDPDAALDPSEFPPKFIKVFKRAKSLVGGSVIIVSKMPEASIDIDNHFVGKSDPGKPLKVDVVSGKHRLKVYLDGYEPFVTGFKITGSEVKRITAVLKKKKFGELELVSNVGGGKIYIDGRLVRGKTLSTDRNTILRKNLAGKHKLEIKKSKYHPFKTEVVLTDRKKTIVNIDLRPINGSLDIFIDKSGTEIFLGDRSYGKTTSPNDTVALKGLKPGSYRVTGKRRGYITTDVPVEIGPGASRKVKLFMKKGTFLSVNTTPPGASIVINGEKAGVSPLSYALNPGTIARVRVSLSGFRPSVTVFTMTGERKLNIRMIKEAAYRYYADGRKSQETFEKLVIDFNEKRKERSEQLLYQYIRDAAELYRKAVGEDRKFAAAYAALSSILFREVELDSLRGNAGKKASSKDIINTILNSQKAIALNNDPLAKALSYRTLGEINFFKANLEKRRGKKLDWLGEAVNSFDEALRIFKTAEISLDYNSVELAYAYFKRAMAIEKMAVDIKQDNTRAHFAACEAWRVYDFTETHPEGSLAERRISAFQKTAEKHRLMVCQN